MDRYCKISEFEWQTLFQAFISILVKNCLRSYVIRWHWGNCFKKLVHTCMKIAVGLLFFLYSEFKSWKRLFLFPIALIYLEKVGIQILLLQPCKNCTVNSDLQPLDGNQSERKTLNSIQLTSSKNWLCVVCCSCRGTGKHTHTHTHTHTPTHTHTHTHTHKVNLPFLHVYIIHFSIKFRWKYC